MLTAGLALGLFGLRELRVGGVARGLDAQSAGRRARVRGRRAE